MADYSTMVQYLRAQFPSLHRPADVEHDLLPIHFDNPAGTQVPQAVIDATTEYYLTMNANQGGTFATSKRNDAMLLEARTLMAEFINAPRADEIVFGPNMTTLNFALSRALAKTLQAGDEIVLTRLDHDANISPWTRIAEDHDLVVKWVDIVTEDATLDMASFEDALSEKTKIVAAVHAANSVGTINPIKVMSEMTHQVGAYFVVDAVQSAPHIPIDVQDIGCDFLLCSAYKFFGPHIGILWGKHELLEKLPAYKVRPAKDKSPYRWETGTPSFETIIGVKAALEYLAMVGQRFGEAYARNFKPFEDRRLDFKTGMSALAAYERELATHLIEDLLAIKGVEIAGITDAARFAWRVPTIAFTLEGHHPQAIAEYLAENHIYVWSGHYYALETMDRLGKSESGGMVRVGLAHYNTHAEIDRFIDVLQALAD